MNKVDCIHIVDGYCAHPKTDPNADLHLRKCLLTISPRMTCVHKEPHCERVQRLSGLPA